MVTEQNRSLQVASPCGSLDAYMNTIMSFPILSAEEEQELAQRYRRDLDLQAARALVMSHLRFVARVARGYKGYGLAEADLIQEGNIGLMKAVQRFDPAVGVRLVSFAVHWIRAEIHEFILRNWRIVKIATTKEQRKLFFNLRSAKKHLGWMKSDEVKEIAEDLGVSQKEVLRMEERLLAHDSSFDSHGEDEENGAHPSPGRYLEDLRFEPLRQLESVQSEAMGQEDLRQAIDKLDLRSREIIVSRWLSEPKRTLQELADQYGISAERIRQIEKIAMEKMKKSLAFSQAL